jgi:diaminohydroxyphosphoribosylaminopyrimidine deaminase/5-amino-6-(5-phosphoribosylamino)uracil reductase
MKLALKEAKKGLGRTSPNPAVGAVIVRDGEVIARGYHKKAGTPHAEINALRKTTPEQTYGATMYVTLEPCSHTGKTPPCCRAIVEAGIARVVIGMTDPNPLVNGNGIGYLRDSGVEVESGVLRKQCEVINYPFIKYITTRRPWVIMKAGVSLDGRLNYQRGQSGWITGEKSARKVHHLRNQVDAILVGKGTVLIDNPSLTTRIGGRSAKDPARVILDSDLSVQADARVFHSGSSAETWVFCADDVGDDRKKTISDTGARVFAVGRRGAGLDVQQVLETLGGLEICSLLVEGGAEIHGEFLRYRLVDYACLFYAPLIAGDGGVSLVENYPVPGRDNAPRLADVSWRRLGDDMMVSGKVVY